MTESSATITHWGEVTFGRATSDALLNRAQAEMDELRDAVTNRDADKDIALEAADVMILLHRLVGTLGFDLAAVVDEKMTINRKRDWQPSGDGTGQHK
ncbi:nucleotide pyrophosphohydrolase [Fretibacter rubidus]|uniref:nucleotide pyrophosphohydrolase n=1 Tax=Fretibacter rubidus TaxID=570162 RepID=UPI00352BA0DC